MRSPKVLATLRLAEELEARLEVGDVNRADLARELRVTRARVTQILKLRRLSPDVLDEIERRAAAGERVSERMLRPVLDLPQSRQLVALGWERKVAGGRG